MRHRGISLAAAGLVLSATVLAAQATPAAPATPPKPSPAPTSAVAPAPAATPAPAVPAAPIKPIGNEIELGRKFTQWFFTAQFDSLFGYFDEEGQQNLGNPAAMQQHLDELVARVGEEMAVIEEKVVMRNGKPQYWRTGTYSLAAEPIMIRWVIGNGKILGIGLNPASQAPPIDPVQ